MTQIEIRQPPKKCGTHFISALILRETREEPLTGFLASIHTKNKKMIHMNRALAAYFKETCTTCAKYHNIKPKETFP